MSARKNQLSFMNVSSETLWSDIQEFCHFGSHVTCVNNDIICYFIATVCLPRLLSFKIHFRPKYWWNFTSRIWKTYTTLAKLAGLLETSYCPTRWNSTFLICFSWYTLPILISTCGIRLVLGTWVQPPKFLICWVLGLLNLI